MSVSLGLKLLKKLTRTLVISFVDYMTSGGEGEVKNYDALRITARSFSGNDDDDV